MPKQILVANKSRKQTVKVHFRQSSLLGGAKARSQRLRPDSVTSDMGPTRPANKGLKESVKCMTFPESYYELLIALLTVDSPD